MPGLGRTRVKVCCIASEEEARIAIRAGADALGLVGAMPSGPGVISDAIASKITKIVPPPIATFLLTSETTAQGIYEHVRLVRPTTVQVVNHIDRAEYEKLETILPRNTIKRVQVIHIESSESLNLINHYIPYVDAFLLDSGRPSAKVPELGGTGRVHDWNLSAEFVRRSSKPVFLAGGLRSENVEEAIKTVKPFGLDLCTGVRTDGRLDEGKLKAFMRVVYNHTVAQ
ncbi:MAG: phosphoribosylanthranilate isomerase [Spirulina sp. SIO3F2]|nr:phosphoribosylanthranilate isomerase [Spirulina sp. SIO3F2]